MDGNGVSQARSSRSLRRHMAELAAARANEAERMHLIPELRLPHCLIITAWLRRKV